MSTTSPQMSLQVPALGDPSPTYVQNISDALYKLDSHDHSAGNGPRVTQAGININGTLPMSNQTLSTVRSVAFTQQASVLSAAADNGSLFVYGNDLYFLSGGNQLVRLSAGANSAGGIGGDYGSYPLAQVSYSNTDSAYYFRDSVGNLAKIAGGSIAAGTAINSLGVMSFATGSPIGTFSFRDQNNALARLTGGDILTLTTNTNQGGTFRYLGDSSGFYVYDSTSAAAKLTTGALSASSSSVTGALSVGGAVSAIGGVTQGSRIIALRGVVKASLLGSAGQYAVQAYNDGATPAFAQATFVPPFAGSVAALSARAYGATPSAGTLVVATGGLSTNASSPTGGSAPTANAIGNGYYITFTPGTFSFSANTAITINLTSSGWSQVTTGATGVEAYLWVYC